MLPPKNRLTGYSNFERIKKKGYLIYSLNFSFLYFQRGDNLDTKIGFLVSKKTSPKAVVRNKIKRSLRSAVYSLVPRLNSGYDILFLGKLSLLDFKLSDLISEIEKGFKKAQVMD